MSAVVSRRRVVRQIAAALAGGHGTVRAASRPPAGDEPFLDELQRATFRYFWEQAGADTGLVSDRCPAAAGAPGSVAASIAATGFGLTALCIGSERGYVTRAEAQARALATLQFLRDGCPQQAGFFYHWMDRRDGRRVWQCEVSSIDTAILLCGVLACRGYFDDPALGRLAAEIYERVDWGWLTDRSGLLLHGWTPERGMLPYRWDEYSELMMLYLLGLGATAQPLRAESWQAWKREVIAPEGLRHIGSRAPLFVHQYSHAWFDFRGKRDAYADYFENSVTATEAHRRCCQQLAGRYPHFGQALWGITASDSQHGYVAWGGTPDLGPVDGTVVPSAAGGSLPFLPGEALRVLRLMREQYGPLVWTRYGFINAFNPATGWFGPDVVAIDTGITLLMAENLRSGLVWEAFSRNPEVARAFSRAGFRPSAGSRGPARYTGASGFRTSGLGRARLAPDREYGP